ncbi:ATP-binding protein [Flavobacterium sp.]|uniref:sensor histidine kinase n=1 Tax=Flavobacterium sp. TaxID=239 RepID=UPI0039E70A87
MKTKTKLSLAVGLLLALILLLIGMSGYYVFAIKRDTQNILKANYQTLEYSRNMLAELERMQPGTTQPAVTFEQNLRKQLGNITEDGEAQVTQRVQQNFMRLRQNPSDEQLRKDIRQDIFEILKLNMDAIKNKADLAEKTADTANIWIGVAGTLCFLIGFNLLVNLPSHIANPIRKLTDSIRQIADRNYTERVHFSGYSEFDDLARSFNTMAEKLQEYSNSSLNQLLVEKKRIDALLGNMHDPVIGINWDGKILSANEEALKIFGLKKKEVVGKEAAEVPNDLLQTLIVGQPQKQPLKIYADGKESYFEHENVPIQIIPTGEETPIPMGRFIILRNITVFKELDFAKTNFIATVSHELKTPISSIKLGVNLLENKQTGELNLEQKQLVDSIREDSQRLLKITGELLEMSQLETGNIQLAIGKCSVEEVVALALDAVRAQAEQKGIALVFEPKITLPEIRADKDKTSWVIINFLTNAIRYAPENSVVELAAEVSADVVSISVSDQGQGIDLKYQPRIFDRYFKVPGQHKSGTGLGLAISREFIEAQGGTIGVESNLGLGSRFWLSLPMA